MRRERRWQRAITVGLFALVLVAVDAAADKPKGGKLDLIWAHPEIATLAPRGIAFMPAVSFTNDLRAEKAVEDAAAASLKSLPFRWLSPRSALALLAAAPAADSLWKVQRKRLLKAPRVDSLAAPALCRALRTQALLTFRIDQYEQRNLEWNEAGKPSTSVEVHAALVDSSGRLLWTASGSELGEGALQDPNGGNLTGVSGNGLGNTPITGTGKAPAFDEVLDKLFARWAPRFPAAPAAPVAPAAAPTPEGAK